MFSRQNEALCVCEGEAHAAPRETDGGSGAWIAVNTHAHKELLASANLLRQSFTVYCPMQRKQIRHARRVSQVLRPFFPGYIFTRIGSRGVSVLYSTYGVRGIVGPPGRPGTLSDDFIAALRAREVQGAIALPTQPYRIGQSVKLTGGAFDGFVAKIVEMDEKQRLTVLMNLLNQQVRVRIDENGVLPLKV